MLKGTQENFAPSVTAVCKMYVSNLFTLELATLFHVDDDIIIISSFGEGRYSSSKDAPVMASKLLIIIFLGHTSELQRKAKMKERSLPCQEQMTLASLLSQEGH